MDSDSATTEETDAGNPRILVFSEFYLPGYKSGGGMRSIVNMIDRLRGRYDFRVVTLNHDGALDTTPYPDLAVDKWTYVNGVQVYFTSSSSVTRTAMQSLIKSVNPAAIYTNSLFSAFTRRLVRLRLLDRAVPPLILAPCGELNSEALAIKRLKKRAYLAIAASFGLHRDLIWKASTDIERKAIQKLYPEADVFVAPDLLANRQNPRGFGERRPLKTAGSGKFVFISRIVPIKNLLWLLQLMRQGISGVIEFDVYGPVEDEDYWTSCETTINELPSNVRVTYRGSIQNEKVEERLAEYHYFALPSLSENFGHAIWEALAAGCPVLTSDNTPWRELSIDGIGWDLPLRAEAWRSALNECIAHDQKTYSLMSANATRVAVDSASAPAAEEMTNALLHWAVTS